MIVLHGDCLLTTHDLLHPRIHTLISGRIAHMQHLLVEATLLGHPVVHQQHRILDRHQSIPSSIHQQQPTTWTIQQSVIQQTILFLRLLHQLVPILISILLDICMRQLEGILMVINTAQPFTSEEQMGTCALPDRSDESIVVGMCQTNGVISACGEAPRQYTACIKLWLGGYPVEDGGPEAVRRFWIASVGRAVCCAWDFYDDACPAAGEKFVGAL